MRSLLPLAVVLGLSCAGGDGPPSEEPPVMVVGVRTVSVEGLDVEVWYPAAAQPRSPTEAVAFDAVLSASILDRLGNPELPGIPTQAVRDAEPRDGPFPAILFSHGFGGTRQQSVTLTAHLAAQGFVVAATDHRGRTLMDFVPCVFTDPPEDGCDLSFDDPGPDDLAVLADWLDDGADGLPVDPTPGYGLFGHSAGGGSTVTIGNNDLRFTALAPMAGGGAITRSDVAVQRWAGTCDGIVPATGSLEAHEASATGSYLELLGAGHLAFSDLCALDLGGIVAQLSARDDVNPLLLAQAEQLAVDGCAGAPVVPDLEGCEANAFLDLDRSEALLMEELGAFFIEALGGGGPGPSTADRDDLRVR